MKKIKTLLTIPALVAIVPATISMASCGNKTNTNDPVIDPTVSEKVDISITRNTDGSATCKLTLKASESAKKITKITVKIGSTTLVEGTDYSIGNTNSSSINVTIFKSTLDKYQGSIVITPKISEFNGLDSELNKTTFTINEDKFSSKNLSVYKLYDGTRGEIISWNDTKLTIWEGETNITSTFTGAGWDCSVLGQHTFTIKYDNKLTKSVTITVAKKTYTITCSVENECVSINKTSIVAEEDVKWGTVKPTITARTDVNLANFDCIWEDDEGNEIDDETLVEESFNANLILTFKNASTPTSIACQSEGDPDKYNCDCYIPAQCAATPATWYDSNNTIMYEFTIDLSSCSGNFQYFWIAIKDSSYTAGGRLLTLGLDNIISISYKAASAQTWSEISKSNLSFHSMNGGTYMKYASSPYTTGSLKVQYRSLVTNTSQNIIPAFEADGK